MVKRMVAPADREPFESATVAATRPAGDYVPIADYAIMGDCRSIALVSKEGSIDWWCLPRFDGDAVFARILDTRLGGYFSIQPDEHFESRQFYLERTNVLITEFTTASGVIRLTDFMPAIPEEEKRRHPLPYREVIRRVECIEGSVAVNVDLRVRPDFGRLTPRVLAEATRCYCIDWGEEALNLVSSATLDVGDGVISGTVKLDAGERLDQALAFSRQAPADLPTLGTLDLIQELTDTYWRDWAARCQYQGPYQEIVQRSALALKLMSYAPSGAIIAASTTSLPEEIGGERNWDYRYCWLRDSAFTIYALLSLGYLEEAHAFAQWMLHATRLTHPELSILYTVFGEYRIPEGELEHLEGYAGSKPVRVGNAADQQFQLDVYGEVLGALSIYRSAGGWFDHEGRALIEGMAKVILDRWNEPDEGIWEVRSGRHHHIHSKVMACVGLERVLHLSEHDDLNVPIDRIREVDKEIRAWIDEHGFDRDRGTYTRVPGDADLDAALLVIPLVRFLPPDDPKLIGTVEAIQAHLADGELVYRYRGEDGLRGGEGAFVICSFWMVEALAYMGRLEEARSNFERLIARANHVGLLAEEIDPQTGQHLGNFPQAFSHIGLINAALTLQQFEESAALPV
jgi:GH15 family glucan-1,4-alpha-glucosidase